MSDLPEIKQLAEQLCSFEVLNLRGRSGQPTNVYVLGSDAVTLIDAGSDDGGVTVMAALKLLGEPRVDRILLTHAHHDHAGSAAAVREQTGSTVLIDPNDLPGAGFEVEPDEHLQAGDVVDAGPFRLQAIATPGHAPGHLSFYEPTLKALFAGDLMSGFGSVAVIPPRGSMRDYLNSLRRVQTLDIQTVYPGHGPVITNGAERIVEYIEHRERRESEILQLINAGVGDIEDLTAQLYPDVLPRFRPLAKGTVLAHIVNLMEKSSVQVEHAGPELAMSRFSTTPASAD